MTKVYLLLRNNKQSGPHSLEELLKLELKPLDLIWIEGRSLGWSYPSEINALKAHVAAPSGEVSNQQSSTKNQESHTASDVVNQAYMPAEKKTSNEPVIKPKVYVSMPASMNAPVKKQETIKTIDIESEANEMANKIEQKAEELRKKIQSYIPDQKPTPTPKTGEPLVTKYSSTIPEREEAYTSWIYDKKVKNSSALTEIQKRWGSIVVAALLILVVGYGISQYHGDKPVDELAGSSEISKANNPAPEPLITEPEVSSSRPVTENNVANDNSETNAERNTMLAEKVTKSEVVTVKKKLPDTQKSNNVTEKNKKAVADVKVSSNEAATKIINDTKVAEAKTPVKSETNPVVTAPKKRKTLNEKVDAFFSKFSKKLEDPVASDNTPSKTGNTSTAAGTNERKAVHRDDNKTASTPGSTPTASSPLPSANLASFVEVTSSKPSENWMLGVHGMKLSLHNTSTEIVKTAEVELRYYTEQNEVLEKKIVSFNNIQPGKTVTLPAPDHRLADHADFRLVTAK